MEIKSKKYINEGFNSKAYIINDEYILLEGVNKIPMIIIKSIPKVLINLLMLNHFKFLISLN